MTYRLGRRSKAELKGVHPDLVRVVELAIQITVQDFTVHDGIRTVDEQREYVERGVSWTMDSRHLPQEDGHGHAVDLVPYINGKLRWEWGPIYKIVEAVRFAAEDLGVPLIWGGCWQVLNTTTADPRILVEEYVAKRQRQGRNATVDGPHFQLKTQSK